MVNHGFQVLLGMLLASELASDVNAIDRASAEWV